ncbi:MAG: TRAP transporter TatT component family protein [Wenzhouxiangella sp.]|nr:TRAP transporter TatT component family protein [Wenzhouxiangella sp.]
MKLQLLALVLSALLLGGCASLINRAASSFANDLEAAIRGYDEPAAVAAALPAFMLIMEARLESSPESAELRLTTARLTQTYATLFSDAEHADSARRLSRRALHHARIGACLHSSRLCELERLDFDSLDERIASFDSRQVEPVYALATSWTGWIAAHSDDFRALADLPRVETLLSWVAERSPGHDDGAVYLYLAVLNSQRPPAAGGQPRKARAYFEKARQASAGRNLLINVLMADSYARLMFDRDLYVDLLESVLATDNDEPEYRLVNQVARARARELLAETEAIFD